MEDGNEDNLVMYEESDEIKETIWKLWDIINDKEVITQLLLNTSLLEYLGNLQLNSLSESKENQNFNEEVENNDSKFNEKGK